VATKDANDLMLTSFSFHSGQLPGNCGVRQAYRLKGAYRSREEMEGLMDEADTAKTLTTCDLSGSTGKHIVTALDAFINGSSRSRVARAVPLEWAYLYTLDKVHGGSYALICLSDTDKGQGDGHGGAFSTRGFAEWLVQRGLGESIKAQNERKDCDYDILGYWIIPDHEAMDKAITDGLAEIRKGIEEWNNDPRVKRSVEPVDEELERELKSKLLQDWISGEYGDELIDDEDDVDEEWEEYDDEYVEDPF
jgi:hypothetical protein